MWTRQWTRVSPPASLAPNTDIYALDFLPPRLMDRLRRTALVLSDAKWWEFARHVSQAIWRCWRHGAEAREDYRVVTSLSPDAALRERVCFGLTGRFRGKSRTTLMTEMGRFADGA